MQSTLHKAIPSLGISSYESKIEATTVVEESFPCTEVAPSEEAAPIELDLPIGKVKKGKKGKKPRRMR